MALNAKQVITIDCYVNPDFGHKDVVEWFKKNDYENVHLYQGNSCSIAETLALECKSVDFLFQDAGHSADDVFNDYMAYYKYLKRRAIVAFHDWKYMCGQTCPSMDVRAGVQKVLATETCEPIGAEGWCFLVKIL